jgi:hypothetical protein
MANTVPQHTHQVDTGLVITNIPNPLPVEVTNPWPVTLPDPLPVFCISGAGTTGQTAVGTTQTAISVATSTRTALTVHNLAAATQPVFIGPTGVTDSTGYALEPGHSQTFASGIQWYAIAAATGTTVSWIDE